MRSASSRSDRRFTRSAAVSPQLRSIRMSRGPSFRKEKPRSGSSSWSELTPRSRRIPSGFSGPRCLARLRQSSWMKRTRSVCGASVSRARACVSASRSTPMRRPVGALRFRISHACPARPSVPSTQRPPGLTASSSIASSRRTGACRVLPWGDASDPELRESTAVLLGEGFLLEEPLDEALLVPHREVVLQTENRNLACHGCRLAEQLRNENAPLAVDLGDLTEEVDAIEESL